MLNGSGRNGKGLMSSMMTESLGDYACASLRHELITDTSKANANGATEGLTPLAYKRYIVMKEPPKGAKMSNAKINSSQEAMTLLIVLSMEKEHI